jgi:hypothetical protein
MEVSRDRAKKIIKLTKNKRCILQQDGAPQHFWTSVTKFFNEQFTGTWISCNRFSSHSTSKDIRLRPERRYKAIFFLLRSEVLCPKFLGQEVGDIRMALESKDIVFGNVENSVL